MGARRKLVVLEDVPRFDGVRARAAVHAGGELLLGVADREPPEDASRFTARCLAVALRICSASTDMRLAIEPWMRI